MRVVAMPVVAALADRGASSTACVRVPEVVIIVDVRFLLAGFERVGGDSAVMEEGVSWRSILGRCREDGVMSSLGARTLASSLAIVWV